MRTTIEAMAAVGGHPVAATPTPTTRRAGAADRYLGANRPNTLALVIQEETGITKVIDPLAGLLCRESPNNEMVREAAQTDR